MTNYKLRIRVANIRGRCPIYKIGDEIVVDEPAIAHSDGRRICIHALGSMLSMLVPLCRGVNFDSLGLSKKGEETGYVHCLDPGPPYTEGGTVLFEIKRERKHSDGSAQ